MFVGFVWMSKWMTANNGHEYIFNSKKCKQSRIQWPNEPQAIKCFEEKKTHMNSQ